MKERIIERQNNQVVQHYSNTDCDGFSCPWIDTMEQYATISWCYRLDIRRHKVEGQGNSIELRCTIFYYNPRSHIHGTEIMTKPYDDSNWKEEYKSYTSNKRYLELLENGPKSLSQAWLLGALYNEWKKMKGYDKLDPKPNEGQNQSHMKEFFER